MRIISVCFVIISVFFSFGARATITVTDIAGAYSGKSVTSSEVTIYLSTLGTVCATPNSDAETCNNCLQPSLVAFGTECSTRYVPANNYFYIYFTSTEAGTMKVTKTSDEAGLDINGSNTAIAANTVSTVKLQWDDITPLISGDVAAFRLWVGTLNVTINVKRQTSGDDKSDCTTNVFGVCDFRMFEGDEKAYLELDIPSSYPTRSSSINFKGVRIYYKEIQKSETDVECPARVSDLNCTIASPFTYNDSYIDIDIDSNKSFDDILPDLENEKHYCFAVVNRDLAENVGYRIYANGSTTNAKCISASPSEVIGLLTKNANCFIATAAYGTRLNDKIDTFRELRNKILLPSKWGKAFVKWYYKMSPEWASSIEKHPTAKFAVRMALWPLWLMSLLILNVSPFVLLLFLIVGSIFMFVRIRKNTATLGIVLIMLLPWQLLHAQIPKPTLIAQDESESPPQEAPFVSPEEELDIERKETQKKTQVLSPSSQATDPQTSERRTQVLKKSIEFEQAQIRQDGQKIQKMESELEKLQEEQRRRRLRVGSKEEKILDIQSKERLNSDPARMVKKTGEVLYPRFQSPQNYGASFRIGQYSPANLRNEETGLYFDSIYSDSSDIILLLDFEYQFFKSFGKLGLKAGSGIFSATGKGRFKSNPTQQAREGFTFLMFPNTLGGVYRLQIWEKQPLVPFVEGGAGYFTFVEVRDDFKRTKYGGSPLGYWAVGGSLLLDFLSPQTMGELDNDYGINHMWLTAEYRSYVDIGGALDFSNDSFNAGIFFEF